VCTALLVGEQIEDYRAAILVIIDYTRLIWHWQKILPTLCYDKAMHIEVEKRYKIADPEATIAELQAKGIRQTGHKHLIDEWFLPQTIKDRAEHDTWFDTDHGLAYRIRRVERPDGSFGVSLESKQLTVDNNHNTFREETLPITDYAEAVTFLQQKGYRNWLTIDKQRHSFDAGRADITMTMDSVAGLAEKVGVGAALEVEFSGEGTRDHALQTIDDFVRQLGVDHRGQFDKSLTVTAMDALARFED